MAQAQAQAPAAQAPAVAVAVAEMTEAEMLDIIQTNFTPELYDWMKREFSDVCSHGDVTINKLLDKLYDVYVLKNKTEEMETTYISSIYNTYIGSYLEGAEPDPFWAD